MCQEVKEPLSLAWAVPEVNRVIRVIGEETPKGLDNGKVTMRLTSKCQMCSRQSLSNILVIDYVVGHLT